MSFFLGGMVSSVFLFSWSGGLECFFLLEEWFRVPFFSGRGSLECLFFSWRDGLERVEDDAETLAGTQCK